MIGKPFPDPYADAVPRTKQPPQEPLEVRLTPFAVVGTVAWAVGALVLLAARGWLDDHGYGWWLPTCVAGFGFGLLGILYSRVHDARTPWPPAAAGEDQPVGLPPDAAEPELDDPAAVDGTVDTPVDGRPDAAGPPPAQPPSGNSLSRGTSSSSATVSGSAPPATA